MMDNHGVLEISANHSSQDGSQYEHQPRKGRGWSIKVGSQDQHQTRKDRNQEKMETAMTIQERM
jgi:hypothetical protein